MSDDSGIDWQENAESRYKRAMVEVVKMAKEHDRICYLYLSKHPSDEYGASFLYWKDWLFRAYPGGRKSLSNAGKKHLKDCQIRR